MTQSPPAADAGVVRRPALSPSRSGDFEQCPLSYRFPSVDSGPETPSTAQVRGIAVFAVLEELFVLPAVQRVSSRGAHVAGTGCGSSVRSWPSSSPTATRNG